MNPTAKNRGNAWQLCWVSCSQRTGFDRTVSAERSHPRLLEHRFVAAKKCARDQNHTTNEHGCIDWNPNAIAATIQAVFVRAPLRSFRGVTMAARRPKWAKNPDVVNLVKSLVSQLQSPAMAARLWHEFLSPSDHRRLGALEKWYPKPGTVGIWTKLRRVTPIKALMDLVDAFGLADKMKYQWLQREWG